MRLYTKIKNTLFLCLIFICIYFVMENVKIVSFYLGMFLSWFFSSPTPSISFLSLVVALSAYIYQRREKRKYNAYLIAKEFEEKIIDGFRFLNNIFRITGASQISNFFVDFKYYNMVECRMFLKNAQSDEDSFHKLFKEITLDNIKDAFENIPLDSNMIYRFSEIKKEDAEKEKRACYKIFTSNVFNTLNILERMAFLMKYNIADEKILYPMLSPLFLKTIPQYYFFIAIYDSIDNRTYFANIKWLYNLWKEREKKQNKETYNSNNNTLKQFEGNPL